MGGLVPNHERHARERSSAYSGDDTCERVCFGACGCEDNSVELRAVATPRCPRSEASNILTHCLLLLLVCFVLKPSSPTHPPHLLAQQSCNKRDGYALWEVNTDKRIAQNQYKKRCVRSSFNAGAAACGERATAPPPFSTPKV